MPITADPYLQATFFIDSDHDQIVEFAETTCKSARTPVAKAVSLYYAVRDGFKYDPFDLQYEPTTLKASSVLIKGSGYCVAKAILLAALGRQQDIPCRLGFADVTNHLSTPKLRSWMGTDLFIYHGYTEMYLLNKWVKATPAFNLSLCTRFNVKPLEFDGTMDSIFHEYDTNGEQHMEYVCEHGHFDDLPFERIFTAYMKTYPKLFKQIAGENTSGFEEEPNQHSAR